MGKLEPKILHVGSQIQVMIRWLLSRNRLHRFEQYWFRLFIISHLIGYAIAWVQTIWLIYEIRRLGKKDGMLSMRKKRGRNSDF